MNGIEKPREIKPIFDDSAAPQWSEASLALLSELNPHERAFAEWFAATGNAAEAYRKITGQEYSDRESDTTRVNGYRLRQRPRVSRAIESMLKDQNFEARWSRDNIFQRLQINADKASEKGDFKSVNAALKLAAEMGGEITIHQKVEHSGLAEPTNANTRLAEVLADALGLVAGAAQRISVANGGGSPAIEGGKPPESLGAKRWTPGTRVLESG